MITPTSYYEPIDFATYDIETLGLIPNNFLYGIVYYGDDYLVFTDRKQMLSELISYKNSGKVLFAHNCAYDLVGLINENILKYFGYENILYRDSTFINAKKSVYEHHGKKYYVRFWDSFRILQSSLAKIGEAMNFPKLEIPKLFLNQKYKKSDPRYKFGNNDMYSYSEGLKVFNEHWNISKIKERYIEYCGIDCKLLFNALKQFQKLLQDNWGISLTTTISTEAFNLWKSNYLKDEWKDCPTKPNLAFRESYFGGKVDIFKWGNVHNNLYYYDINSLYPAMGLLEYPHPYKLFYTTNPDIMDNYHGVGYFKIISPDMHIPILPYKIKGKLTFPIGRFEGWYNFNEIKYAIENGYECEFIKGYFSYETTHPLRQYYLDMYALRMKYPKTHFYNLLIKYLLNSLYGRFGLRIENKEYMYETEYWDNKHKYPDWQFFELDKINHFGYTSDMKHKLSLTKTTYNAIPSYLTSYCRIYLHKFLNEYQDSIVYCDTDSMILDNTMLDEKYISKELGDFKLEGIFNNGWFLGNKYYILGEKDTPELQIKIKGVKLDKDIKYKHIKDIPKNFNRNSFYKTKEALRLGKTAGSFKIAKKLINPLKYDKREYESNIDYYNEYSKTYPILINNP